MSQMKEGKSVYGKKEEIIVVILVRDSILDHACLSLDATRNTPILTGTLIGRSDLLLQGDGGQQKVDETLNEGHMVVQNNRSFLA